MKIVIVFNHPYEGSYCNAVLQSVLTGAENAGHVTDVIHLDNDQFNPVMTGADLKAFRDRKAIDPQVLNYKERLATADHLVMIFPIWWELMPAMTKGFIDKVIFPGVAYDHAPGGMKMLPLFTNLKGVTMITTMNTPGIMYRFLFGNAIKKAVMTGTFWKTGYKKRKWINLNMVKFASDKKRRGWLTKIENRFAGLSA